MNDVTRVTYLSGAYQVTGFLAQPDVRKAHGKLPGLVYCRGGIGRVGMVRTEWMQAFASRGLVVMAPAYRGNEGGEGRDEFGGGDVEDTNAAVRYLREMPEVDPERVSVMGFSRGAVNAFQTAIEEPGVHRLVLWGGVSDLAATYEERMDLRKMLRRVIGGTPSRRPESYQKRSAAYRAAEIPCPVLIVHGTADVQVDVTHAYRMMDALARVEKSYETHLYDGIGHHPPEPIWSAVVDRWIEWLLET